MTTYKASQGKLVRRVVLVLLMAFSVFTFFGLGELLNGYRTHDSSLLNWLGQEIVATSALQILSIDTFTTAYLISTVVAVIFAYFAYGICMTRVKQVDFLIDVETELRKVAWPIDTEAKNFMDKTRQLRQSSVVVFCVIIFLAGLLFVYDNLFKKAFEVIFVHGI